MRILPCCMEPGEKSPGGTPALGIPFAPRWTERGPDREHGGTTMKMTILTHHENENDPSHDVVVDQVAAALRQGGHRPSVLGVHGDVRKLISGLSRRKPELVFNLMETFGESQLGAVGVVGLLDLLGVRYTGGGP